MKKILLLISIVLSLLLCGCAAREIERGYLVSAIGFSEKGGQTNIYIEALNSSNTTDKPSERVVLMSSGISVENAFENLKQTLIKPLYFEQLGTVIFEEKINSNAIEFLKDMPNINYGIYLVKTDNLDKLFTFENLNEPLGYVIIGLLKTNEETTGQLYKMNRSAFYLATINTEDNGLVLAKKE